MADPSLGCLSTGAWGGEELRKEENRRRQIPGSPGRRVLGGCAMPVTWGRPRAVGSLEADGGGVDTVPGVSGAWVAP